jgi:tyrosine-protein kinase Etk/Wzc
MTAREDFSRQFQEYLRIVYEGRWLILVVFLLSVIVTWFYTAQQDDIYQSHATIRLKRAMDPMNYQNYQGLGAQDLGWGGERIIANEIRVIKSQEVTDRVAERLLAMAPPPGTRNDTLPIVKAASRPSTLRKIARALRLEGLLLSMGLARLDTSSRLATQGAVSGRVRGQTSAAAVSGLDFIEIVATSTSPREAAHLANLTVEAYKRRNLEAARENITTARGYLESQLESKRDSLNGAENEMRAFQQSRGVMSLDEETTSLIQQLTAFEAQRDQAKIELEGANRVLAELNKQLRTVEPNLGKDLTDVSDPVLKQLQQDKAELEIAIQRADMARKDALRSRPELEQSALQQIRILQDRLAEVNKRITQVTTRIVESGQVSGTPLDYTRQLKQKILAQESDIEALKARLATLDKTIAEYNVKFESIPANAIEFARLERKRQSFDKLAGLLDQKFQEAVINEQTTMGSVDVVDHAGIPGRPVKPNRPLNMLIGVLVGLALGLAISIGLRYLDTTIRNPEDVEKLGFPVLTFVPTFGSTDKQVRAETLVTLTAPQSPPSEAYRTMRTSIENSLAVNGKSIVVLITSPAPKEGKSTAIANLAVSSASSGRRVLLIDADLRRPVQHNIFQLEREPGLSNCLVGEISVRDAIRKTQVPGLHLMPCGHIPSHPAELLGSNKMAKLIELLRQHYDLVLVDSPPVIAMADTLVIGKHTDGVVLVVSADSTKILGLQKARELLQANNCNVAGVVVNRFNANKIYYSYYRYYYQNYYYYSEDGTKKRRSERRSSRRRSADAATAEVPPKGAPPTDAAS